MYNFPIFPQPTRFNRFALDDTIRVPNSSPQDKTRRRDKTGLLLLLPVPLECTGTVIQRRARSLQANSISPDNTIA